MARRKKKLTFTELFRANGIRDLTVALIILVIAFNCFQAVFQNPEKYLTFNYWGLFPKLKQVYRDSQYVNKNPKGWIPDETVNSYAGGEYISGVSPVLIAADTPPLGRYIIGLSAATFNNANITTIIFSFMALGLMYLVSTQIFKSKLLALVPSLLFSFEPIFKNQIIYSPLLDIFQLVFLLGSLFFFNKGINTKKALLPFMLANIFLGFFISTKFFITGITIIGAWYLVLVVRKDLKRIGLITLSVPLSFLVLLSSYARLLFIGYSVSSFLGVQKWVFLYHKSQLILPLSVWPLLLLNKWYVWFGDKPVISDPQWMITWPIITVIFIITTVFYCLKKIEHNKNVEILIAWSVLYLAFFSFGQISSRYFVILIPILYIISLYGVVEVYKAYKK